MERLHVLVVVRALDGLRVECRGGSTNDGARNHFTSLPYSTKPESGLTIELPFLKEP